MAKIYINLKDAGIVETVDEISTEEHGKGYRAEAKRLVSEYRMGHPGGQYYLSSRACKKWRDAS